MNIEKIAQIEPTTPDKIEVLKKYFPDCFDKNGNFLIDRFQKTLWQKNIDISKESYSLEWLGRTYARVLLHEPARTFIKADKEWNEKKENKNSQNLLIKGDNLEVLKHMVNAYTEQIKMIYIDPPYNTQSNNFVYQDNRKFTPQELSKLAGIEIDSAKRILDFVNSKSNSHSAWLTFMYPRLYIARHLLKDDGAIFVSIDDNEVAQLRLLMDEIFGEENFVGTIIRQSRSGGGSDSVHLAIDHDYMLVYVKNNQLSNKWFEPFDEKYLNRYKHKDEKGRFFWDTLQRKGLKNPIKYDVQAPDGSIISGEFVFSKARFENELKQGNIRFVKLQKGTWSIQFKQYLNEKGKKPRSILSNQSCKNSTAKKEFINLLPGQKDLANAIRPKPTELIKWAIRILEDDRPFYILDFFAGSGTTGDAVMQLNAEDGGSRKFILVQLPEPIDPKKNKTAYEFVKNELGVENPTIFDITKERLVRAAKKIVEDRKKEIEEVKGKIAQIEDKEKKTKRDEEKLTELQKELEKKREELKHIRSMDAGFKIFETIDLPPEILKDCENIEEEILLPQDIQGIDSSTLLATWKLHDGVQLTEEAKEIDLNGYIAYLAGNRLYLLDGGFTIDNLTAVLKKIDNDSSFAPSKIVANGYALNSIIQKEIDDSILNFINKKHIELEFIVRY